MKSGTAEGVSTAFRDSKEEKSLRKRRASEHRDLPATQNRDFLSVELAKTARGQLFITGRASVIQVLQFGVLMSQTITVLD